MENIFFDLCRLKYLGRGAIVGKTVRIRHPEKVVIGDGTIIDDFTYISGSVQIGSYSHVGPNCTISGGAGKLIVGNYVGISSGCSIHLSSSDYYKATLDMPSVPEELRFGGEVGEIVFSDFVLLGSHTIVLPGVFLPEGFATAAQTVVRARKYKEWTLYAGFDCKKIAHRDNKEILERKDDLLRRCTVSEAPD